MKIREESWVERLSDRKRSPKTDVQVAPPKPLHERKPEEFAAIIIGGCLLSFNAGFINAVTLAISGFTVSHVTGDITKAAIAANEGDSFNFWMNSAIVLFFIFGSMLSGILIPYSSFHLGRAYNKIFILGSCLLVISIIIHVTSPESKSFALVVAITCGMQNAMTTKYSNNILRTTHMTGTATDIGIVLGRIIRGRTDESWRLAVLVPMLVAFFLGCLAGGSAETSIGTFALLMNLFIFAGTGVLYSVYIAYSNRISVWHAMFMNQDLTVVKIHKNIHEFIKKSQKNKGNGGKSEGGVRFYDETINPVNLEAMIENDEEAAEEIFNRPVELSEADLTGHRKLNSASDRDLESAEALDRLEEEVAEDTQIEEEFEDYEMELAREERDALQHNDSAQSYQDVYDNDDDKYSDDASIGFRRRISGALTRSMHRGGAAGPSAHGAAPQTSIVRAMQGSQGSDRSSHRPAAAEGANYSNL
jgi:uncharacterized membrane protein YoaK (UPF0700 family)